MKNWLSMVVIIGTFSVSYSAISGVKTCGLNGSIDERIRSCAQPVSAGGFGDAAIRLVPNPIPIGRLPTVFDYFDTTDAQKGYFSWNLVSRTGDGKLIWRDAGTRLIWSDTLNLSVSEGRMQFSDATQLCQVPSRAENIKGYISAAFRIPSIEEWEQATLHGMKHVLREEFRRLGSNYWTAEALHDPRRETIYCDWTECQATTHSNGGDAVRCVLQQ